MRIFRPLLAALLLVSSFAVWSQSYPSKTIRILVGFTPGGGVDIAARTISGELQKALGQPVVIENRPGAGGSLAADLVAKAPADGYTLLMGNTGSVTINPSILPKIGYDPLRDFTPIVMISSSPLVLATHLSLPARTLPEVIALAKKQPGQLSFGTSGNGSISHLTMEMLKTRSGMSLTHIPYKGGSAAIVDLIAEHLPLVMDGVPLIAPFAQQKKLRALAVTSPMRSPMLPEVPTLVELGYPDLLSTAWYGIMAPAGTPAEVVNTLNRTINQILTLPSIKENLASQGSEGLGGTPAFFSEHLKKEVARWAAAIKESGAKAE